MIQLLKRMMSYTIFSPPAIIKGAPEIPQNELLQVPAREMHPLNGLCPLCLKRLNVPSGLTTAMVYAWRVGTSICEMLKRINRTAITSFRSGISGTIMSRIFEGRFVKTMVRISPIFFATGTASRAKLQPAGWRRRRGYPASLRPLHSGHGTNTP